jgi:crotonobetainyl-CoA:carnitine CoA-transferase CaiB-like acyl-CoA transferase
VGNGSVRLGTNDATRVINTGTKKFFTTRCPIRINGEKLYASKPAPQLGADNEKIKKDFLMVDSEWSMVNSQRK